MGLNFTSWTPWKYDTGEETAVSVIGTIAKGALYFTHEESEEQMKVSYHAVSIRGGQRSSS